MPPVPPPRILVLASTKESQRRLTDSLQGIDGSVWWSREDVPNGMEIDLLVTDLWSDAVEQQSGGLPVEYEDDTYWGRRKRTVLGIGTATEPWADLTLSDDYTPRELRLACTLLGEVSRLRAERDRAAQAGHESRQLAHTDPLTGLANRRAWDLRLQNASAPIWLAIVDLDQFKQVNDRCGLVVGDRVLQQVAQSLAHSVRRDDLVVRLGGDEFGVLLSGIDESAARGVLERLRSAVSGRPADESVGSVTVSIGYASSDNAAIDCAQLLAAAERGLRCAKQSGGDCVCRAGDE